MKQIEIEMVGKVFVVVGGNRKCLICDGLFTVKQASNHAPAPCYPRTESSHDQCHGVDFICACDLAPDWSDRRGFRGERVIQTLIRTV